MQPRKLTTVLEPEHSTVHLLPVTGSPLENTAVDTVRTSFTLPDAGFLLGPENHLIETAVRFVLEDGFMEQATTVLPGICHPLLLYGPSGCGKTHLAVGIFAAWKAKYPKRKAACFAAQDFVHSLADAAQSRNVDHYRTKLRSLELLVIDDIELLHAYEAAQEELLHSLDVLEQTSCRVVLTTKQLPGNHSLWQPRLQARVMGGCPVAILLPGEAVRLRFLQLFVEKHCFKWSSSVLNLLAKELPLSLRGLYGAMMKLLLEAEVAGEKVGAKFVQQFLKKQQTANSPTVATVTAAVAKYLGVKVQDIKGKSRQSRIAEARAIAIYLTKQLTALSLKDIGEFFGKRDHTTISHLHQSMEKRVETTPHLRDTIISVQTRLLKSV